MKYADSDAHEPSDASPRIVNGLTVRPRKKVNLWYYGICLLPDFAAMLVAVAMGMRWLLRHSDPADKEIDMPLERITFKFDGVLWILMLAVSGLLWGVAGFPNGGANSFSLGGYGGDDWIRTIIENGFAGDGSIHFGTGGASSGSFQPSFGGVGGTQLWFSP